MPMTCQESVDCNAGSGLKEAYVAEQSPHVDTLVMTMRGHAARARAGAVLVGG